LISLPLTKTAGVPEYSPVGVLQIPINERSDGLVFKVLLELLHVQTDFSGDRFHLGIVSSFLVGKQFSMDFPKLSLLPGCECGDGCLPGIIVTLKRKMLNHKFYFIRVFLQHLLECRLEPRTVGSLVVIENGDGDAGLLRTFIRQTRQVKLMNRLKKYDPEGLLRAACQAEQIGPPQRCNSVKVLVHGNSVAESPSETEKIRISPGVRMNNHLPSTEGAMSSGVAIRSKSLRIFHSTSA